MPDSVGTGDAVRLRARLASLTVALAVALGLVVAGPVASASAADVVMSGQVSLGTEGTLAGAGEVRVYYRTGSAPLDVSRSVLTDASGGYSFTVPFVDGVRYSLYFDYLGSDGFNDAWLRQNAAETSSVLGFYLSSGYPTYRPQHQVLTLPGSISGTVTLAGTTALPAAGDVLVSYRVWTGDAYSPQSAGVPVQAGGAYSLTSLPVGYYTVIFTYAGAGPYQNSWYPESGSAHSGGSSDVRVRADENVTMNMVQPRQLTATGSIHVGDNNAMWGDGLAAAGAFRVDLERYMNGAWSAVPGGSTVNGANGEFSIPGLVRVPHRAIVTYLGTDGHAQQTTVFYEHINRFPGDWREIDVHRAINVGGTVYLGDLDTPAGAGDVSVEYRLGTTLVASAITTTGGAYLIRQLPVPFDREPEYDITYRYIGSGNYTNSYGTALFRTDTSSWDALLDSTAAFSGHVTLGAAGASAGLGDVTVRVGARSTQTDAAGNWRLEGMSNGYYTVQFLPQRGSYTPQWWPQAPSSAVAQRVYVDGSGRVLDINLPDAAIASGRLTTPAGAPIAGLAVTAEYSVPAGPSDPPGSPERTLTEFAHTDANGVYTFGQLRAEEYRFSVNTLPHGPNQQYVGGSATNPHGESFVLAAGETRTGLDAVVGAAVLSGVATCGPCGTNEFYFADTARFSVEARDDATGLWSTVYRGLLDRPSASFHYQAIYPGIYRVAASYGFRYAGWGSGYSAPVVVAASDRSTSVVMSHQAVASRIGGANRFDVSAAISQEGFGPGVPVVYIADGMNYPDALSAAPAAARQGGPLLLVSGDGIPAVVAAEIARLQPLSIVVVGGPGSVTPAVFEQLRGMVPTPADITRLGGADRYAASRAVASFAFDHGSTTEAYITTGNNFPDALSAGGAASKRSAPVITVDGHASAVDADTRALLIELGVTLVRIAGGPGSVSPGIAASIDAIPGVSVERLWGEDRYSASGAINRDAFGDADTVFLSVGSNYPDALSGGALAGLREAPLYVIPGSCIPYYVLEDIRVWSPSEVIILGGPGSVAPSVLQFAECPR